jgi:hypothetical protein
MKAMNPGSIEPGPIAFAIVDLLAATREPGMLARKAAGVTSSIATHVGA